MLAGRRLSVGRLGVFRRRRWSLGFRIFRILVMRLGRRLGWRRILCCRRVGGEVFGEASRRRARQARRRMPVAMAAPI